MTQATMEKDVTTTNQMAADKKVTISVPNKGTVKTIDAAVDDVLDISPDLLTNVLESVRGSPQ